MGMSITGSGNSYVLQMQQQNDRHAQLNSSLYENRKASQSQVVQAIQNDALKQTATTASIKEEALSIGGRINTFA